MNICNLWKSLKDIITGNRANEDSVNYYFQASIIPLLAMTKE